MLLRRLLNIATLSAATLFPLVAAAQTESPDALVKRVSADVLDAVKADPSIQAGDVNRIVALVDAKILPYFDFDRMTAAAAGPNWAGATPDQKQKLAEQFKILLIRVYSGALSQARGRTIELRPPSEAPAEPQVVVRSRVVGSGEAIELDFRLARTDATWKIYDMNVGGVWLVDTYRSTFSQEIAASGIDGLIAKLGQKNQAGRG